MRKTAIIFMLISLTTFPFMSCSMIQENTNASKITNIPTSEAKVDKATKNTTQTPIVTSIPTATMSPTPKPPVKIKNSADDSDYSAGGTIDFSLNGGSDKKILTVTSEDISDVVDGNKPIKITLDISGSQVEFKSDWNDGIQVSVADFDKSDNFIDVYVTECGTDISCNTYIYRCDGYDIFEYDQFTHFYKEFFYDENGYIYYSLSESDKEINKYYDYNGKCKDINDVNLKDRLTDLLKANH